jgi:hypothetical protein
MCGRAAVKLSGVDAGSDEPSLPQEILFLRLFSHIHRHSLQGHSFRLQYIPWSNFNINNWFKKKMKQEEEMYNVFPEFFAYFLRHFAWVNEIAKGRRQRRH